MGAVGVVLGTPVRVRQLFVGVMESLGCPPHELRDQPGFEVFRKTGDGNLIRPRDFARRRVLADVQEAVVIKVAQREHVGMKNAQHWGAGQPPVGANTCPTSPRSRRPVQLAH